MKKRKENSLRDFHQIFLWTWFAWKNCVMLIWNLKTSSAGSLCLGYLWLKYSYYNKRYKINWEHNIAYFHHSPSLPAHACDCNTDFFSFDFWFNFVIQIFRQKPRILFSKQSKWSLHKNPRKGTERTERFSTYFQGSEFGNTGIFIIIVKLL